MENDLTHRTKRLKQCHHRPIFKQRRAKVQFADLPEDLMCTVFSKMPLKDVVRTSVLSSKWRRMWTCCTKLRFDGVKVCTDNVSAVLQQHSGKIIEEFKVKFEFDSALVDHLDDFVDFAVSSRTKNLAFDLEPTNSIGRLDRYRFPFERLDNGSISCLQHIQLSFSSLELPTHSSTFVNLRKLDLHFIRATQKGLQDFLSHCFNIEWLSLVRCHLYDELKLADPLPRLLYLRVAHCEITKFEFNATNLKTFIYHGWRHPIDLGHAMELKDASLYLYGSVTLKDALTILPSMFPSVECLRIRAYVPLKVLTLLENPLKFSHLKYLHLWLTIVFEDASHILSISSFLRAAPCVKMLEIHFDVHTFSHVDYLDHLRGLPGCNHFYLRNLRITGFVGSTGQFELLIHIVENASILEDLTIETAGTFGNDLDYEGRLKVEERTRKHLRGIMLPYTKLYVS